MKDLDVKDILEDFDQKFKIIQEGMSDIPLIRKDLEIVKKDVTQLKEDMIVVKTSLKNKADASRVEIIEKVLNI